MEIHKMKVFIYILTFGAYAWSGYGSTLLEQLRDAVLTAEDVFGDMMEKAFDVLKAVNKARNTIDAIVDEKCKWTCPDGVKPKPNKYYKPTSNGCGPEGLNMADRVPFREMTGCCNDHDICYGTCNKEKEKCDADLKRCLYGICEAFHAKQNILTACKGTAKLLCTSITALGCKFYQDAQSQACFCPIPRSKYNEL